MPTETILSEEKFALRFQLALQSINIASRNDIRAATPSTIRIIDADKYSFQSVMDCLEGAATSKGNLIELLFHFHEAGDHHNCNSDPDYYWIAEIVSSESWSQEVNERYWSHYWDGNFDNLGRTVSDCYNEFFPVIVLFHRGVLSKRT